MPHLAMPPPATPPPGPATRRVARALRRSLREHDAELGVGPLVLAVSGGADSLALLLAATASPTAGSRWLVVAHFSHGLRPSAERREEALVRRVAAERGVDVRHERATVPPTEAGAREARYGFLARAARATGAAAVVTAHTRDDQAETLLLRLARGTGLRGAGAIRALSSRDASHALGVDGTLLLLRPLLDVTHADTLAVCAEAGVRPASDGSNRSLRFARNRVRHRVLPELARVHPEAAAALARFADGARADDDLLRQLAHEAVVDTEERSAEQVTWSRPALVALPRPLLARVLQAAWEQVRGPGASLTEAKLAAAGRLLCAPDGGRLSLGGGVCLVVEQRRCVLEAASPEAAGFDPVALTVPGVTLAGPWAITTTLAGSGATLPSGPWEAAVDLERLGPGPGGRSRLRGEHFQPLGMPAPVRLQDVLVNAKVPRSERAMLPLIVSDAGIAWVAGVRIAEWVRVSETSKRVLLMEARRR